MSDSSPEIGQDTYTLLSERDERALRVTGTAPPKLGWMIAIHAEENPTRLPVRRWFDTSQSMVGTGRPEDVRVDGRDAVRLRDSVFGRVAYVVALEDRAFVVALVPGEDPPPPSAREDYVVAMAASLQRATGSFPAPLAPPTPEALADQLAAAFAARDAARLGALVVPTCFFTTAVANTGPVGVHPQAFADDLRARLAGGLAVSVQTRPIGGDPARPPLEIRSTWTEHGTSRGAALELWPQQGSWYWSGVVFDRP